MADDKKKKPWWQTDARAKVPNVTEDMIVENKKKKKKQGEASLWEKMGRK